MSDARRHGIQAYKGHSKYVRGKKIKIDIPQPEPSQELDLTPEEPVRQEPAEGVEGGEEQPQAEALNTPSPPTPPTPTEPNKQVVVIDGEALQFERSISWECMPQNLEVLLHDSYFMEA